MLDPVTQTVSVWLKVFQILKNVGAKLWSPLKKVYRAGRIVKTTWAWSDADVTSLLDSRSRLDADVDIDFALHFFLNRLRTGYEYLAKYHLVYSVVDDQCRLKPGSAKRRLPKVVERHDELEILGSVGEKTMVVIKTVYRA